jgi:hypothetical protein
VNLNDSCGSSFVLNVIKIDIKCISDRDGVCRLDMFHFRTCFFFFLLKSSRH